MTDKFIGRRSWVIQREVEGKQAVRARCVASYHNGSHGKLVPKPEKQEELKLLHNKNLQEYVALEEM